MKIMNVMFSKVNGGLEQVFLNYIPALLSQGNQVISVVHPQAEIIKQCPKEGLRTVHNFNQYDFLAIHKLRKLIRQVQPDCIITHSYRAAYLVKKTHTQVPKVAVCHVQGHYNFGADALIALTDSMREEIIRSGIPEKDVFTVPNMLPIPKDLVYTNRAPGCVPTIGVCARFVTMKGLDVFLAALSELKKRAVSFNALIAGDGPEKEHYLRLISTYELDKQVTLLGWVDNKASFYNQLDIFCLPSRKEAFGLVILESMVHSLPAVLTDLPGPREIIAHSNSALFTPVEDPISMANCLEHLINDVDLRKKLASNAFNRVHDYSIHRVGPVLQDVLQKISSRHPP
jgi:glycosyltransferase involved in cell wall biosynthesis